jgi:L-amino acid N-acyltransferase YncA/N-acetylglutamate synthase-like GNAT family acetyltransferase
MITLRRATRQDWPAIEGLLVAGALPLAGASQHLDDFLVAVADDVIVGTGGLEFHGDVALLRSLAIAAGHRHRGLGRSLVDRLRSNARLRGAASLYLLTTTAADYFTRLGFAPVARAQAPEALESSAEFRGACPASAALMSLALAPASYRSGGIRSATVDDAESIAAIYAPVVRDTAISFELEPPSIDEMRDRIAKTLPTHPWLVSIDDGGAVRGYAHAGRHRERAAYRWSVDTTAYVREDSRHQGHGQRLYDALFAALVDLGYCRAFAGIALPNDASVRLHESVGFQAVGIYRRVGFKLGAWRDVGWWQRDLRPGRDADPPGTVPAVAGR